MIEYPLWTFLTNGNILITRGETQEQAFEWASRDLKQGETIAILDYVPLYANYAYDINHNFNWLYVAPKWVKEKRMTEFRAKCKSKLSPEKREAIKIGIGKVIENLKRESSLIL